MNIKSFSLLLATTTLVSGSLAPLTQAATTSILNEPTVLTSPAPVLAQASQNIMRKGDSGSQAGTVSEIATAYDYGKNRVVTAVRTAENRLKLISWRVNNNGSVTRTGDSGNQAGVTSRIDLAPGLVSASRTTDGKLKLISWEINNDGDIVRRGDSGNQAGNASIIKIMQIYAGVYVTAVRTTSGDLKLITWRLNDNGSLTRLRDSGNAAGAVTEIAMSGLSYQGRRHVVTAVRASQGNLKLIVWRVDPNGTIIRRGDSGNQAGSARMIRAANSNGHIVTSVRTAEGNLKLITWEPKLQGGQLNLSRVADSGNQAGGIGDNALIQRPGGVTSAVKTREGTLKLISWRVSPSGAITRLGDSSTQAGTASLINLNISPSTDNSPVVTSVRTAENRLKLISWDDQF
ncbi:MAG: hypothetical protein F6K11_03005 [Leptolyngbya sp. SIO3F4]|nr:hypothetical protein [Leptolyngbya sp. SIO3F4]